jgi:hypothetical protein
MAHKGCVPRTSDPMAGECVCVWACVGAWVDLHACPRWSGQNTNGAPTHLVTKLPDAAFTVGPPTLVKMPSPRLVFTENQGHTPHTHAHTRTHGQG